MRPPPGHLLEVEQVYIYRQCRSRLYTENVFEILATRWGIFQRPITASTREQTVLRYVLFMLAQLFTSDRKLVILLTWLC